MKVVFLSLAACLTFVAFAVQAQNDFATWSLQSRIGSASRLNPAFRQVNKVQIGLPLLSSYEFGMGNTGFTLQEVSHFEGDTFYFDPKKLPDALSDRNFFYVNQNIGLLSVCINRPVYSMEIFSN